MDWKPRQSDIDWTKDHINSICEGGQWIIPTAGGSIFTFHHTTKTYDAIVNATNTRESVVAMQTMTVLKELGYLASYKIVDANGSLVQSNIHEFQKEHS